MPDDPTGAMSNTTGGPRVPPEPASGDAAQGQTSDTPERSPDPQIHPRWATTTWWRVVSAVEITVLAVLGYMAKGDRYPLVRAPCLRLLPNARDPFRNRGSRDHILCVDRAGDTLRSPMVETRPGRGSSRDPDRDRVPVRVGHRRASLNELPTSPVPPPWRQAYDTCSEQYPTAAEEAFARWRVPDECRDIWLNAAVTATTTTTTTDPLMEAFLEMRADKGGTTATTLPTVDAARAGLRASLDAEARAALKALDDSHEVIARALDKNDQAALIALLASLSSDNQSFKDNAQEAAREILDFSRLGRLRTSQ